MIGCQEELDEIFDRFRYELVSPTVLQALKATVLEYLKQLEHEGLLVMEIPVVDILSDGPNIWVSFKDRDNPYREFSLEDLVRVERFKCVRAYWSSPQMDRSGSQCFKRRAE